MLLLADASDYTANPFSQSEKQNGVSLLMRGDTMKNRKILAICLITVLALGLVGCSCSNNGKSSSSSSTSSSSKYNPLDYVTLGQYEGVEVQLKKSDYEVTDDKVKEKMKEMCGSDNTFEADPDKKVVTQDSIVNVDYVGSMNGVPFSGGSAQNVWIDVKGNKDAEKGTKYIDGFTNGISGARVGTQAAYNVTFPENYGNSDLAGKEVVFTFTINSIAKDKSDELTDDYVKSHSNYQSVKELRDAATAELTTELQKQKEDDIKSKVTEKVVSNATVKSLPEDAVNKQVDQYMKYYEKRYASNSGMTLEKVIQTNYGQSLDEFKQQVKEQVEEQMKTQIVFEAIAEDQKMTVDEEGFKAYVNKLASENGFTSLDTMYKYYSDGEDSKAGEEYLKTIYLCNKALDYCISKANVIEV